METMVKKREGTRRKTAALILFLAAVCALLLGGQAAFAAGGLSLSTDYPGISIKPGDNLNIPITLENESGEDLDAQVSLDTLPEGWEGYLQGGSYQVSRIHVENGGEGTEMTLHVTVPKELSEGTYTAEIKADAGMELLPPFRFPL